jgi:hemolysin III
VFGYHELFHLMVIAAAGVHYTVILDVLWSQAPAAVAAP